MKDVYILNPIAGSSDQYLQILDDVKEFYAKNGGRFSYNITQSPRDATEIARFYAKKGEPMGIFACGGDGTVSEVASGIIGQEHIHMGVIPCGSGNDFLRTFGTRELFSDLDAQKNGTIIPVDAIKCNEDYAINICSVGMDADVAYRMLRYKKMLKKGSYYAAIFESFFRRLGLRAKITIDDTHVIEQKILLAYAANGKYYGGGFEAAPKADPVDGLLDFLVADPLSRFNILSFIGHYRNGDHEPIMKKLKLHRGQTMKIEADKPFVFNRDGECSMTNCVKMEAMPKAVRFLVPKKVGSLSVGEDLR